MSHTPFPHISELYSFFGVFDFSSQTPISPICRTPLFPISQNVILFFEGLPVGVLCGNKTAMTRADPTKAARVAYVIGTFAGHPAVMGSMNAFLKWHSQPSTPAAYVTMHANIAAFIKQANAAFKSAGYPVELVNWFSVWSMMYTKPGRYHWMLQYYLKDAGVALSWVGTGRCLFSLDWTPAHYGELFFAQPTHFSHMSHPTFPISHILFF